MKHVEINGVRWLEWANSGSKYDEIAALVFLHRRFQTFLFVYVGFSILSCDNAALITWLCVFVIRVVAL